METVGVKIPEGQKKLLDEVSEKRGYPSKSEYIRELLRKDLEKHMVLREEVAEEVKQRKKDVEDGNLELEDLKTTEEVFKED